MSILKNLVFITNRIFTCSPIKYLKFIYDKYVLTLERISFINVSCSGLDVFENASLNSKFSKAVAGNEPVKTYHMPQFIKNHFQVDI